MIALLRTAEQAINSIKLNWRNVQIVVFAVILYLNSWPPIRLGNNCEWPTQSQSEMVPGTQSKMKHIPVLHVVLDLLVGELTTNETLERKDSIRRVNDGLTFGRQTD
jgi:hypothetical protein